MLIRIYHLKKNNYNVRYSKFPKIKYLCKNDYINYFILYL